MVYTLERSNAFEFLPNLFFDLFPNRISPNSVGVIADVEAGAHQ